MDKRFIFIFLLALFPSLVFSQEFLQQQELDQINNQQNKFFIAHVKVDINNVFLNGANYIETKMSPFFKIENFYFALEFPLRIDATDGGILNSWDYIYPNNYLNFVQMLGYKLPDQSFDMTISSLTDLSLGDGLLISHFRNDLFLPNIRELGLNLKGQWKYAGFQLFTSNIENFGFGGISLWVNPLKDIKNIEAIKDLSIYSNFIYDIDTQHILMNKSNKINLRLSPHSDSRYAYSVGLSTPIYKNNQLVLSSAIEQAGVLPNNQYGVLGKFSLDYEYYHLGLGLAYLANGFHMNVFSPLYFQPNIRNNRTKNLKSKNSMGYEVSNQISFFNQNLNFYLDLYGQTDPLFSYVLSLELKPYILAQFYMMLSYITEDIHSSQDFWDPKKANNFIVTQIGYRFGDNAQLAFFYRRAIGLDTGNKNIRSSNELSVKVSLFF